MNSMKGETPLKTHDGREFTLVLDMEAMLSIEEKMGKPLPQIMKMAQEGYMTAAAGIAQAAFARNHPELSRADVLEILRTDSTALEKALSDATANAFPKDDGKAGNGPAKARGSKRSGRSGAKPG